MATNRPSEEDVRRGMTVKVVQNQENNDGEPLIGDILHVVGDDDPGGVVVELESGVTGEVVEIRPDEGGGDVPQGGQGT